MNRFINLLFSIMKRYSFESVRLLFYPTYSLKSFV